MDNLYEMTDNSYHTIWDDALAAIDADGWGDGPLPIDCLYELRSKGWTLVRPVDEPVPGPSVNARLKAAITFMALGSRS